MSMRFWITCVPGTELEIGAPDSRRLLHGTADNPRLDDDWKSYRLVCDPDLLAERSPPTQASPNRSRASSHEAAAKAIEAYSVAE
jgi:hypothetical protein